MLTDPLADQVNCCWK